jgi:DNA-binding transcriptional LysR family regulator
VNTIVNLPRTTVEQWAVLAAVVDEGGFAQAATAMHRSQSAVSYSVARLQESLDLPVLSVEGRRSVLTPQGDLLLTRARSLIKELESIEALARSLKKGWESELTLVVDAAFPRSRLLSIIAELQSTCPSTQIQLSDVVLSGAEQAILESAGDLVITSRVPPGVLGDWLMDVNFLAVARPDHVLFQLHRDLTTDDLVRHVQSVVRDSGTSHPRDEGWLGAEHRFTVSSMDASLATILAGLAYAWLPEHMLLEPLQSGVLRRLPLISGASRRVSLHIVPLHPQTQGPAARAAVEAFHKYAKAIDTRKADR